jgi:FemAB-related protein (PEP-CTERM system-associated)
MEASGREPTQWREQDDLGFLDFGSGGGIDRSDGHRLRLTNDIVYASYWLLTGAREPSYRRDRFDNLHLEGSFFLKHGLAARPLVSEYGALLRRHFAQQGRAPAALPWSERGAAFAFTHDVDYPEIIRSIECARLLASRGFGALPSIAGVLRGSNHFWKFADWVEFERALGTRPTFYFLARKGSLAQYAMGTPDGFYDIRKKNFTALFRELRAQGCEIGLHASFHAHRSAEQLRREKEALEQAADVKVEGNRHHYWHLDPAAPHETLHRQEQAGLLYDSSLAFEFYPGFRRGICHPFRPYHLQQRRELNLIELPPAWMDDHFDRRLKENRITDPAAFARELVRSVRALAGVVVVDYHARGMNADFYPRYGEWLRHFVHHDLDSTVSYQPAGEIVRQYRVYEDKLASASRDRTDAVPASITSAPNPASTRISLDFLQPGETAAWEAYVEAHPKGTIYHSLDWKAVTEEGLGHKAYYLRGLNDAGNFVGVLPLFLVTGIYGRRLVSMPMRDRGGLLYSEATAGSALLRRARELTCELSCKYFELRSSDDIDPELAREHGLRIEHHWVTTRMDLTPGPEKLWKVLDRNAERWAIRNARRKGVLIEEDPSERGIETFYELFARTRTSLGIPPFPKQLFRSIQRHLISRGKANLLLARKDDTFIGGLISVFSRDSFIPAYAAPQREFRKLSPSDCVLWHAIEWASRNGFRIFDFGADSPRQEGLLNYKKKWGGVQHRMSYAYYLNGIAAPPDLDSSSPAYNLMRGIWKALPVPVSKRLGDWTTRQLS